jgi:Amino acid transporters
MRADPDRRAARPLRDANDTGDRSDRAGPGAWVDVVSSSVQRRLGTADAVALGLAAMLGTGVFAVWAPAAATAGPWLLLAVVLAGIVAACNAASTSDLAVAHPESGGGYVYGRERLCPAAGRLAGVAFLVGKTASAAAAAGVFGGYVLPSQPLPVAVLVIVAATALNTAGVRWTARGAYALVGGTLAVLIVVVVMGLFGSGGAGVASAAAAGGRHRGAARRRGRGADRGGAGVLRLRRLRPHRHPR